MQIPGKDGTTTTFPDKDGKPLMKENNCAYLSEHVGESIDLFVGEIAILTMAKPEEVFVGKDAEGQRKAGQAEIRLFATNYVRAGRWQDAIYFHIHTYQKGTPPTFTDSVSTDHFVELTVLDEQVAQPEP